MFKNVDSNSKVQARMEKVIFEKIKKDELCDRSLYKPTQPIIIDSEELTYIKSILYSEESKVIGEIIMITYEDALHIAKDRKEHIDNGTEYEKYYVFRFSKDDNYIGGYVHTPVVIAKEDGRILSVPEMIVEGCGDDIKPFEIQ